MSDWQRPRALRPGDLVGVCAPSGPPLPDRLDLGLRALGEMGFRVREGAALRRRHRFSAGPPAERLADLHALWADDEVAAVWCARGGAGASRLVDGLDLELLRAHPKVFVGYSDLTLLHLALGRLRQVSVHGPMVARELADGTYDRASLAAAVSGDGAPFASGESDDLLAVRAGVAEGRLLGGCLSLLAAAAGTPLALAPQDDTILFLEDVDEAPYRLDRMLWQLRASGALAHVRGVVLGDLRGCAPRLTADFRLEELIADAFGGDVPIALGLSSGHTNNTFVTLPLGVRARLTCGDGARLEVLEPAVA